MADRTAVTASPVQNSVQNLDSKEVQHLRCALGQSRADFARVFGVSWEIVMQWEQGILNPTSQQHSTLIRLSQQAEAFSEKTMLRPALEVALKERKLDQIHESDVRLNLTPKTATES